MSQDDFDGVAFVEDYDTVKLNDISSEMRKCEVEGRQVTYLFEPDDYSLSVLIRSEKYTRVGSTNYDKFSQTVPISLRSFEISEQVDVLIVESEYNVDYYTKKKLDS